MARRPKRRYAKDPEELRERTRAAGVASQQPDVLIRRLARMDLTDSQRQQLAALAQGDTAAVILDADPVMLVRCPYCGAGPGDVCRSTVPGSHRKLGATFHGLRHQAARAGQAGEGDAA